MTRAAQNRGPQQARSSLAGVAYDTTRDPKGLALALAELLEEGFVRARVICDHADEYTQRRIESAIPQRTLSPGYYHMAEHFLWLSRRMKLRALSSALLAFEMEGLAMVETAEAEFASKHPTCSACGARQDTRWNTECHACHVKFRRGE